MNKKIPFLWLALDDLSGIHPGLLDKLWKVEGRWGAKLNLDDLLRLGFQEAINRLPGGRQEGQREIFADAKIYNGSRTMVRVVQAAAATGVSVLNFHTRNSEQLPDAIRRAKELGIKTLGLTELSHGCVERGEVHRLIAVAERLGMDGVICPGYLVAETPTTLEVLATGMRAEGPDEHQPHAVHPAEMFGIADSVAIGSPIMKAEDPAASLRQHLSWLSTGKK